MDFEISAQRQAYLDARGKVILNACPGSGKTTCIIRKLSLLETECNKSFGQHTGIVCLSFTNVAKNEIQHKYKQVYGHDFAFPNLASTIDSFINQYLTLPFFNVLHQDLKRPQIVDQAETIDSFLMIKYESKGKLVEGIRQPFNKFKNKAGKALYRSYPPSAVWVDVNGNYTFKGKQPGAATVDHDEFQAYGKALMNWKIKNGFITSLDSAFLAMKILAKSPKIGEWLVQRFPYMIVDEAQDNSEIQHAIFDKLIALGLTNIEMIGDPYQSLYEWRDAKPHLFMEKFINRSWTGLPLSQNRRSVQRIIDCFSIIRHGNDEPIITAMAEDLNIPIIVYQYNTTNPQLIVNDFEHKCAERKFQKNHIVVRGTTLKDRMLGNVAIIKPWATSTPATILKIKYDFETNAIKDAVTNLRKLVLEFLHPDLTYHEMQQIRKDAVTNHTFNGQLYSYLFKIPATTLSFENWSEQCVKTIYSHFSLDMSAAFSFKKKMDGFKMADLKKLAVNLYFNKPASNKHNIPVTTIHQVKGATLDAILYFFDESSTGESVSFKDFKRSETFPTEKQRMIYVACSRPQHLLALAFPVTVSESEIKSKFGNNVDIICL